MNFTVVYKTRGADLIWLKYSLMSLAKFASGFDGVLIYCHDVSCENLRALIRALGMEALCVVIPVSYDYCGYIKQMVTKAMCFRDVATTHVVIMDSDVVFTSPFDVRSLVDADGKIHWRYIENGDEPLSVWTVWKKAYEDMTKTPQDVHFMENHFPFAFSTRSLRAAHEKFIEFHGVTYDDYCLNRCAALRLAPEAPILPNFAILATIFEEFEWLGFYCRGWSEEYLFHRGGSRAVDGKTKQYWSHGGLTPEIQAELNALLAIARPSALS